MENFQLSDLNLNFQFDFDHDFNDCENSVIDNFLANPDESNGLFDTAYVDDRTNSASFFDYLCDDSATDIDVTSLENLPKTQLVSFSSDSNQLNHDVDSYPIQQDGTVAEQNVNFDWTSFLDESSDQTNATVAAPSSATNDLTFNGIGNTANVICDNGFVYQELKTLDVPQMYSNLDERFGLMDLRTLNNTMDYSALQSDQNDQNTANSNAPPIKHKLFFLPMDLNQNGTESLLQVATKMNNHSEMLNSMLNKCAAREIDDKILLRSAPKKIKAKAEQYLTVNEQLKLVQTKEIILPKIERKPQPRKRKTTPKVVKDKVPVEYAYELVLTDILKTHAIVNSKTDEDEKAVNAKKATKAKKVTPKVTKSKRRTNNNDETLIESRPTRRSTKKTKSK